MSSKWTHNICKECWDKKNPNNRQAHRAIASESNVCCYCGQKNSDGIYLRDDPNTIPCKGVTGAHDETQA